MCVKTSSTVQYTVLFVTYNIGIVFVPIHMLSCCEVAEVSGRSLLTELVHVLPSGIVPSVICVNRVQIT